jgi:hypothetical protein
MRVKFSLDLDKKISAKEFMSAVYKAIAFVATYVCLTSPTLYQKLDRVRSLPRGAIVRSASTLSYDILSFLIITQGNELRMPQVVHVRPLDELELPHQLRL